MDTFSEMQSALLSDLNVSNNSSLFPTDTIKLAINRSYRKAGGLFKWPQLKDAQETNTQSNTENYDYPDTWRPDSIWRLDIDDVQYGEDPDGSPMDFNDYIIWKDENTNSTDKKWANFGRQYFIYPIPTTATGVISVWGYKNITELVNDSDTTIFSYSMPECQEAVLIEAREILKLKGEDEKARENSVQMLSPAAYGILSNAFNKIRQEQAKYERTQPFLNVTDMFDRSTAADVIGNF